MTGQVADSLPSPYPPEEDQYLTAEEAAAFLDEWANNWNYPPLRKPKGLPPRGGHTEG